MFKSLVLAATASLAVAAPLSASPAAPALAKRSHIEGLNDVLILNYGLTLEHLEDYFYADGLRKYSVQDFAAAGYPAWVRERVSEISYHERGHVKFVADTIKSLNGTAVAPCSYKFPDTTPASFLAVAQILEGVGVSAYLGAAEYIMNKDVLTAAGSILGVEARHAAWIRSAAQPGNAFPQQYDTPLDFNPVFSLASAFITACPTTNPALPFKAFPTLTLTPPTAGVALKNGDTINLKYNGSTSVTGAFAIFLSQLGQTAVPYDAATGNVVIPSGSDGQSYVVIASANETISDKLTLAGPAAFEVELPSRTWPSEGTLEGY